MKLARTTLMIGVAVALTGCANRLPTATSTDLAATSPVRSETYVVVRTTSLPVRVVERPRPKTCPAPPPAVSVPRTRTTPQKAKPAPSPCVQGVLFTPQKDCVFDPCDPCAGGRCSVPR